jgi:hypothetical protein
MELTRIGVSTAKQMAPRSIAIVDIIEPWGEYYARNQRTIPPMLYADMVVQSGINFDAFGLQFVFGKSQDGMFVRDMFQVSSAIDRFSNLGKPLHISQVQVPSRPEPNREESLPPHSVVGGGRWRGEWSEAIQSDWLKHFYMIALSKPFVESVNWHRLVDVPEGDEPAGGRLRASGLIRRNGQPKPAYDMHRAFRAHLYGRRAMPA